MRTAILVSTLVLSLAAQAAPRTIRRIDGSRISPAQVDETVQRLIDAAHVTGLQVAVLNDGRVVYLRSFGLRNVEMNEPLTPDTIMYAASFTKAAFACVVMQLVEEGRLDLDRPVYRYLPKPLPEYEKYADLAGDERWKLITARMLLSHTAGFPNWRWINDDQKLDIKFAPGSRYSYSGEGINLLGLVVETVTGQSVGQLMQDRLFTPLGMTRTSMTWQPQYERDVAIGYDEKGAALGHNKRMAPRAAGSMDTTIVDYAKFIAAVMQRKGLRRTSFEEMFKPQVVIRSVAQFPTPRPETTDENRAIRLSYGLGWGVFFTPHGKAVFKEGHDDGWENHSVIFLDRGVALVLMSSSANGDSIFKELLQTLIGDTYTPWKWEDYAPFR